jgi:hypothetical protein
MGRLYGRDRFQPGRICGQIWLLQVRALPPLSPSRFRFPLSPPPLPEKISQSMFYTAFVVATFVSATLVGIPWSMSMLLNPVDFNGASPPPSASETLPL